MSVLTQSPHTRFRAPDDTTAPAPPEYRGLTRDGGRMMVAGSDGITHGRFSDLPDHLAPGDLVVVNTSATLAAEVDAYRPSHGPIVLHAASQLDHHSWVIEMRSAPHAELPVLDGVVGEHLEIGHLVATISAPYPRTSSPTGQGNRLWLVEVDGDLSGLLLRSGRPIAYGYLNRRYPLSDYQSVFSTRPGSAEMPSAGRPFTDRIITRLVSRGVGVAPITLHTGVSSQDAGEAPPADWFEVPEATAALINAARAGGGRVIAVGTTVTRAIESAVDDTGAAVPRRGWTERVVTESDPARIVNGLITGWHNPEASHLLLVESIAGAELTQAAYDAAVDHGYLWHEFGDSALLLAPR